MNNRIFRDRPSPIRQERDQEATVWHCRSEGGLGEVREGNVKGSVFCWILLRSLEQAVVVVPEWKQTVGVVLSWSRLPFVVVFHFSLLSSFTPLCTNKFRVYILALVQSFYLQVE